MKNIKLNETYDKKGILSTRLLYSIRRILTRICTFEELLNYEKILLKKVEGVHTHQELIDLLNTIKAKKAFIANAKKALATK